MTHDETRNGGQGPQGRTRRPEVTLVVAVDRNRVIGREGGLPWHLPADLQHFRRVTMGHPIVMGRKTHLSIGRPLPGRRNIVLSRRDDWAPEAPVELARSVEQALALCHRDRAVMVVGGAEIYRAFFPFAQRLELTEVDTEVHGGDTWFPHFDRSGWECERDEPHPADERNPHPFRFSSWVRRAPHGPSNPSNLP